FAPRFPFETWILPTRHRSAFEEAAVDELRGLAELLGDFLRRMDRVLHSPPFNFMLHTAPLREGALEHFHWHLEIIPKLTNVAGYAWGSGFFINPVPPEDAAAALREDPACRGPGLDVAGYNLALVCGTSSVVAHDLA